MVLQMKFIGSRIILPCRNTEGIPRKMSAGLGCRSGFFMNGLSWEIESRALRISKFFEETKFLEINSSGLFEKCLGAIPR